MSGRIIPITLGKGPRVPGIGPLLTFWPLVARQHTPVSLPCRFCGQRGLEGYSPWGRSTGHDWLSALRAAMRL